MVVRKRWVERLRREISSRRAQHLVFLLHVWACAPFVFLWMMDSHVQTIIGQEAVSQLRTVVVFILAYLLIRTWVAWIDPPRLQWQYVFPPIDAALITIILCVSHRGPMSNLTLLFFLPIIEASGTLKVKWAAFIGLLVVIGTALSSVAGSASVSYIPNGWRALIQTEPLNVAFRMYYLIIISSLMTYQSLIGAGYRERLGAAQARHRISQEMHDGVQGHLITVASQLELLSHLIDRDSNRAKELTQEARETARQAADELRYLVRRTDSVANDGEFLPALQQYAHHQCERNGLTLNFQVRGSEDPGNAEWETMLFRIAQEALNNTIKHARATAVTIELTIETDWAKLELRDNGEGFDIEGCIRGMGMTNMRMRATKLGGELAIETSPGTGTMVRATLPRGSRSA